MYDMEQYSFCKILDKMTKPILREKKSYTGEDPESQLRQFFCVPRQVQDLLFKIFLRKFHCSRMIMFTRFLFLNVPQILVKSVK